MTHLKTLRYSGRNFSEEEIQMIKDLIQKNPSMTRKKLSHVICEQLEWYMADGDIKEVPCRKALLRMEEHGLLRLPPPKVTQDHFKQKIVFTDKTAPYAFSPCEVNDIGPLEFDIVTSTPRTKLWNEYIHRYHYLGYKSLPGAQLKYLIKVGASGYRVGERFGFMSRSPRWK